MLKLALFLLAVTAHAGPTRDYNQLVLEAVNALPPGGGFANSRESTINLGKSIFAADGKLGMDPAVASPSYCSGSTYQVFLTVLLRLQAEGMSLPVANLLVHRQPDGEDAWGRWNANGPGTGRFFFELGLGRSFSDFARARPGDFLKIFWNEHIGKLEKGHSVIYIGTFERDGHEFVRVWASNPGLGGRSFRDVPREEIIRAVFSRLEHPENISRLPSIPKTDPWSASLLTHISSEEEMNRMIGIPTP